MFVPLRSMRAAQVLLQLAIAGYAAAAQPQPAPTVSQSSSGPSSPNVYAPNGQVILNFIDINSVIEALGENGDKVSRGIIAKLRSGDFDAADQMITKDLAERRATQARLAFLYAAKGAVAQSRRQPLRAERAFALATALAPSNCEYRGRWALSLTVAGRLEKLNEVVGQESPEAVDCLKHAPALDIMRLLLPQIVLAAQARQATITYDKLDQLEDLSSRILRDPGKVTWEAAIMGCHVASLTEELRRPKDSERMDRLVTLCEGLSSRAAVSRVSLGRLVSGYTREYLNDGLGRIGFLRAQIALVRAAPRIGELGLDQEGKDVYLGRLLSELGFLILWSDSPDLTEVRKFYSEALKLLDSRAAADFPDALISFSQLVFRIVHFNEMFSRLAIRLDLEGTLGAVARRVSLRPYDPIPAVCHGLNRLDAVIRLQFKVVQSADTALATTERNRCLSALETSAPAYLDELRREAHLTDAYALREQGSSAEALLQADKAVSSALAAQGFPYFMEESVKLFRMVELRAALQFDLKQHSQALQDSKLLLNIARRQKSLINRRVALQNIYAASHRAVPEDRMGIYQAGWEWMQTAHNDLTMESRANANRKVSCTTMWDFLQAAQAGVGSAFAVGRSQDVGVAIGLVQSERERAENCTGVQEAPGEKRAINHFIWRRTALAFIDFDFAAAVLAPPVEGQGLQFAEDAIVRASARLDELGLKLPAKELPVSTQLFETWQGMRAGFEDERGAVQKH